MTGNDNDAAGVFDRRKLLSKLLIESFDQFCGSMRGDRQHDRIKRLRNVLIDRQRKSRTRILIGNEFGSRRRHIEKR